MERVNEACDKCKKDCLLIHRKRVPSFCKTMTDKSCLQVLEGKGIHLVKWQAVQLSKKSGGLGVKNLGLQNVSLLSKWLWRFGKEDHALWKDVIISKYGQTEQWTTNTVISTYGVSVWRTIRNLWPKLSRSIGYKVGEGTRILFWKDKWIGQNSLMEDFPDLFSFCGNPEASIAETWTNQGWNIIFRRLLNDWEVERVASLLQRLNDFSGLNTSPDTIRWKHDRDGKFSVGRLYRRNLSSQPGNIPGPWKQIWKSNIPTKIKCFTWTVKEETNSHLFLHCRVTSQVWHMFLNILQRPCVMPEHTADLLTCWMRRAFGIDMWYFLVLISAISFQILPPKFALSVSHLADQVTHVEDSSGLRWRVTVCYYQGLLAIQQGWPKFASQHRLDVGDLLVFQYAPGQHFTVQIFDTNGCEKIIFCCDTGKGKKRAITYMEETTQVRDAQYDHEDSRLCLHQSRFEMPASKPLAEVLLPLCEAGIKATGMVSRPAEDIPLLGPKDKKSKKASQFDSGEEEANGNEKVIKSKPAGLGDTPSFPAINYSCLVSVNGRDFLELPESWRDLLKRPMRERWIIFLRGPDKRIWPTYYTSRLPPYYSSRPSVDVLTRGWKDVAAAYGMNAKDDCLFQLADQQNRIFDIRKI
ncbi:hypothetical protein MTR67_014647 [Solanum verrucosum]|uniref:TF-B3 domain-containing protein n=1 Tax=Solanum verrucosum TaxID=315347 RepID=A0AAF0TI04_SOLVR|nr:hypothetical protein MTR67_014647 [Solanum verrucosum]